MDWILEHLKVVIAIAAAIAYWLNSQRKAGADERDDEDSGAAGTDANERTRHLQEEIRRKIEERRRGQPAAPSSMPPPVVRPRANLPMPPFGGSPEPQPAMRRATELWQEREAVRKEAAAETNAHTAAVLERQERLAEELRALEAARITARKRAAELAATQTAAVAREQASAQTLAGDLRDARDLRRAVIWREVLGPPVGLR